MVFTIRDLNTFVTALGTINFFDAFTFEVEGCGELVALEEEDENPEKSGLEKFGLELVVEYPEKDELEAVLGVGLLGCKMWGNA